MKLELKPIDKDRARFIKDLMEKSEWNFSRASKELDVTPQALHQMCQRLGLIVPKKKTSYEWVKA